MYNQDSIRITVYKVGEMSSEVREELKITNARMSPCQGLVPDRGVPKPRPYGQE